MTKMRPVALRSAPVVHLTDSTSIQPGGVGYAERVCARRKNDPACKRERGLVHLHRATFRRDRKWAGRRQCGHRAWRSLSSRQEFGRRRPRGVLTESAKPMKNAFTIDVEDYFQVSAFEGVVDRKQWIDRPSRVENNTRRLLDLVERHHTKATCFVLGWIAERHPNLVREIDRRGHDVACHGYSHRLIYNQTPAEYAEETRRAKDVLEQLIGRPVRGYRAASYSITKRSLWALDTLIELGFEYDSSIFPVRHDRYGIPDAPRSPHIIEREVGSIVEFPISTLDLAGFNLPVGGGGYFRIFPYWLSAGAIALLNRREQLPAMFYVHPWEIDPEQPRIQARLLSRFRHYYHLEKCEGRLDRLLTSTPFTDVETVLAAYRQQHELSRMSYGAAGVARIASSSAAPS